MCCFPCLKSNKVLSGPSDHSVNELVPGVDRKVSFVASSCLCFPLLVKDSNPSANIASSNLGRFDTGSLRYEGIDGSGVNDRVEQVFDGRGGVKLQKGGVETFLAKSCFANCLGRIGTLEVDGSATLEGIKAKEAKTTGFLKMVQGEARVLVAQDNMKLNEMKVESVRALGTDVQVGELYGKKRSEVGTLQFKSRASIFSSEVGRVEATTSAEDFLVLTCDDSRVKEGVVISCKKAARVAFSNKSQVKGDVSLVSSESSELKLANNSSLSGSLTIKGCSGSLVILTDFSKIKGGVTITSQLDPGLIKLEKGSSINGNISFNSTREGKVYLKEGSIHLGNLTNGKYYYERTGN